MKTNDWAFYIGHFIIAMNEIDWMTHVCKVKVLNGVASTTWTKKVLAERLKCLCEEMKVRNDSSLLKELISA